MYRHAGLSICLSFVAQHPAKTTEALQREGDRGEGRREGGEAERERERQRETQTDRDQQRETERGRGRKLERQKEQKPLVA